MPRYIDAPVRLETATLVWVEDSTDPWILGLADGYHDESGWRPWPVDVNTTEFDRTDYEPIDRTYGYWFDDDPDNRAELTEHGQHITEVLGRRPRNSEAPL